MTGQDELKRRAIERLHRRHVRRGLADVATRPAASDDELPILLLGGFLAVTLLASVLIHAAGG